MIINLTSDIPEAHKWATTHAGNGSSIENKEKSQLPVPQSRDELGNYRIQLRYITSS
jgi:hypothetical protein